MLKINHLLGYDIYLIQNLEDCKSLLETCPSKISYFGFDTETDTKIDMSKTDGDNIDIKHDKPFLIQFGFNNVIYLYDIRTDPSLTEKVLVVFDKYRQKAKLALAHNIKFDINMLWNIGYEWYGHNACDTMTIARLALESKSEREGGYSMGLKPLATRLLGSSYAQAGKEVDAALRAIWTEKLKELAAKLKPYGISRRQINDTLKNVTGTLDMYSENVQRIWNNWAIDSRVSYADVDPNVMYKYGAVDVILVLELAKMLLPIVKDKNQLKVLRREMSLILPLVKMERTGYTVDKEYLIRCKQALIFEINAIKELNFNICGERIAPNQHQAIKDMLLKKFGYDLESTDKNRMHIIIQNDETMPAKVKEYLENVIYLRNLEKWISS